MTDSSLLDILAALISPREASAEVIPMDQRAKELLSYAEKDPRTKRVVQSARNRDEKARVYAETSSYRPKVGIEGLARSARQGPLDKEVSPGDVDVFILKNLPGVLPRHIPAGVFDSPSVELEPVPDPVELGARVLAHELGHFLNMTYRMRENESDLESTISLETIADLLGESYGFPGGSGEIASHPAFARLGTSPSPELLPLLLRMMTSQRGQHGKRFWDDYDPWKGRLKR